MVVGTGFQALLLPSMGTSGPSSHGPALAVAGPELHEGLLGTSTSVLKHHLFFFLFFIVS
jgi:hypothetical protein